MCTASDFVKLTIEVAAGITQQFSGGSLANPTQGLFGGLFALALCDEVRLYGFDTLATHNARKQSGENGNATAAGRFHYYNERIANFYFSRKPRQGRHVHDLLGESRFLCETLPGCWGGGGQSGRTWRCVV
jgi:hypothetical protein